MFHDPVLKAVPLRSVGSLLGTFLCQTRQNKMGQIEKTSKTSPFPLQIPNQLAQMIKTIETLRFQNHCFLQLDFDITSWE